MSIASLNAEKKEIVRRAMAATFDYFTFDFGDRIGIEPDEMRKLLDEWPNLDDSDDTSPSCVAINNSFNDLLYGEGISETEALVKSGSTGEKCGGSIGNGPKPEARTILA